MTTDDWKSTARRLVAKELRTGNDLEGKHPLLSNRAHLSRIDKGPRELPPVVLPLSQGQHPDIIRLSLIHSSIRRTPAMEAGLTKTPRDMEWLVGLIDD